MIVQDFVVIEVYVCDIKMLGWLWLELVLGFFVFGDVMVDVEDIEDVEDDEEEDEDFGCVCVEEVVEVQLGCISWLYFFLCVVVGGEVVQMF